MYKPATRNPQPATRNPQPATRNPQNRLLTPILDFTFFGKFKLEKRFKASRSLLIPIFLFSSLLLKGLASQTQNVPIGSRNEFTYFIKADPIHGDDSKAKSKRNGGMNPNGRLPTSGNLYQDLALTKHPYVPFQNTLNAGPLQQAPYSFKTVTAAIQYINDEFVTNNTNWQSKGWKRPNPPGNKDNLWIKYIVIQCLPGLYAPKNAGEIVDSKSGLPYNGESFPLSVPLRVCIQGTSALDTVFDARHRNTHIFRYYRPTNSEILWKDCFLDSLTIRGARVEADGFPNGAGVYLGRETKIRLVISNCIITDNWVGIAIDSDEDETFLNTPIIVNNTLAWNRVGIWNGDSHPSQPKLGYGKPRIYNNIMDSGDPFGQFGSVNSQKTTPHWGLSLGDLSSRIAGQSGQFLDYNAYDKAPADSANKPNSTFTLPFWPGTSPRNTILPTLYSPRVDIQAYTKAGTNNPIRGSLYLNDILRHSQGWDLSPHDFRLAFLVSTDGNPPSINQKNPLVDQGVSSYPLTFSNGQVVIHSPGLPSPGPQNSTEGNNDWNAADFANLHSDDWDGEGYGNPRIFDHPSFVNNGSGFTDLGFDEVHRLVIGGFIQDTRIFGPCVPDPQPPFLFLPIGDHSKVYFFNFPGTYNRPIYTQYTGQIYTWWPFVQGTSFVANPDGNYTKGETNSYRYKKTTNPPTRFSFLKNLQCDFSGDLLPDTHPAWALYFTNLSSPTVLDPFASNSWYHNNDGNSIYTDNPNFYYDLNHSILLEGTPNPPGTTYFTDPLAFGYLKSNSSSSGIFGPFGYSGPNTYTVPSSPSWGFGDNAGPDVIPNSQWYGVRYDCQADIGLSTETNLQTLLGVSGPCVISNSQSGSNLKTSYGGGPKVKLSSSPGLNVWSNWEINLLKEMARRKRLLQK